MVVNGELTFTDVSSRAMARVLESFYQLSLLSNKPFRVYVQGYAATRKGDIVFLNSGQWYELQPSPSTTERKQFFSVCVDGQWVEVKPEKGVFASLKISFE